MQAKKEMHLLECNAIFVEYPYVDLAYNVATFMPKLKNATKHMLC